ncbi:Folylpolyglutamate synthase, partial [Metarhizium majus ARSEF 297]
MATTLISRSQDAIDALNSLQTPYAVIEERRKLGIKPDASSIREMRAYLARIGYTAFHVAGTKGKGSTCAFVDSILSQYQRSKSTPSKTGLFISPHLIAVRERIRIDSAPISEDLFAKYFFQVWDRLGESNACPEDAAPGSRPLYARYLTLMSWHAFLQEGVDCAVYETGIGGEFDATNIVERPVASGISTLGIDHVFVLGDTVDKIAWHKAGIMKPGSPAFTVEQVPSAAEVLQTRAKDKGVDLKVLSVDKRLARVKIRPDALFQKKNATLAIALAESALRKLGAQVEDNATSLPKEFTDGLEETVFRGRCEVKDEGVVKCSGPRIMIFNQQGRTEAVDFLTPLQKATSRNSLPSFDHAVFCTNVTYAKTGYKRDFVNRGIDPKEIETLSVQKRFADKWSEIDPGSKVVVIPTIEEALDYARRVGEEEGTQAVAYVTGSLHLVGGALGILEKADAL